VFKQYITRLLSQPKKMDQKHHNLNSFLYLDSHDMSDSINSNCYSKNVVVYKCVNLIANTASHVPWIMNHSHLINMNNILKLLKRPNPAQGGAEFFSNVIANKLLFGNSYILAVASFQSPTQELYILDNRYIELIIEAQSLQGYKYNNGFKEVHYSIDRFTKQSQILHLKNYNPNNNFLGVSCLSPSAKAIELHDKSSEWNNALLKNGARPSGALVVKDGNYLNDEQFERLKEQLNEKYTGAASIGKPILLEGGLDWKEMSISPKDMDFIESKNAASREIALAFGVPPQLLGITGDNTYSNMQEARLALWEETIIPLLDYIADALSNWLSHWHQEEISLDFDRDGISALTERRENLWSKIAAANFMTLNEKRAKFGLAPLQGGDALHN